VNGEEPFADPLNSAYLLPMLGFSSLSSLAQKQIDKQIKEFGTAKNWDLLADFVIKTFMDTGRIRGDIKRSLFLKMMRHKRIINFYLKYKYFSELGKKNHYVRGHKWWKFDK